MKIIYCRASDKKLCNDEYYSKKHLGKEVQKDLFDLINAIEDSALNLNDVNLPQYRLHPLKGNKDNLYSLTISKKYKYRIEFIPLDIDNQKLVCNTDLTTFYKTVKNIKITEISEHYD